MGEKNPASLPSSARWGHREQAAATSDSGAPRSGDVEIPERHREYFDLILANPDIFSGFFHIDLEGNVLPKLALLRQFGFYPAPEGEEEPATESCGAHSPRIEPQELATRTQR